MLHEQPVTAFVYKAVSRHLQALPVPDGLQLLSRCKPAGDLQLLPGAPGQTHSKTVHARPHVALCICHHDPHRLSPPRRQCGKTLTVSKGLSAGGCAVCAAAGCTLPPKGLLTRSVPLLQAQSAKLGPARAPKLLYRPTLRCRVSTSAQAVPRSSSRRCLMSARAASVYSWAACLLPKVLGAAAAVAGSAGNAAGWLGAGSTGSSGSASSTEKPVPFLRQTARVTADLAGTLRPTQLLHHCARLQRWS